jgi:hypothetical protein
MAERNDIPSSHVPGSAACGLWETLLADALDGLLKPEDEAGFAEHMAICPACTALFEEARRGRQWIQFLSPEPEVPAGLLDKILAQTGPGQVAGYGLVTPDGNVLQVTPAWQRPGFVGHLRRFAEPRLMMTAAMAFFSIALTLNLTGVRLSAIHFSDLRPSMLRSLVERRLTMASTPIIRYYDHLRLVYEVESTMREMRREAQGQGEGGNGSTRQQQPKQTAPGESQQAPSANPGHKDGGSRADPPQQSGYPTFYSTDFLEASLTFHSTNRAFRRLQVGTLGTKMEERSTEWIA